MSKLDVRDRETMPGAFNEPTPRFDNPEAPTKTGSVKVSAELVLTDSERREVLAAQAVARTVNFHGALPLNRGRRFRAATHRPTAVPNPKPNLG